MKQFVDSANLLQTVSEEAQKNSETARELVGGLNEAQLNWKPAPDSWSIAQCLEHLSVSLEEFGPYLSAAIAQGHDKYSVGVPVSYRPTWIGGWLARQLLPETTRKLPAPKLLKPTEGSNIQGAAERFQAQQQKFLEFVRAAAGVDYNKTRLRSPVTALMRYSLADAFVINVVHEQRHLQQAQRVKDRPEFPK